MRNLVKKISLVILFSPAVLFFVSCTNIKRGNDGNIKNYPFSQNLETDWIRNGDPIQFEGELWYPQDGTESLLDSEVYLLGEYRGVQFFVDKLDVRPFNRLYTKFGVNKFRYYTKRNTND